MNELNAIVTGASSGIGREISRLLLNKGYRVYGMGRTVSQQTFPSDESWHPIPCDLTDTQALTSCCRELLKLTDKAIDVLVLSAGKAWFAPHETHQPEDIAHMADLNLKAPLLLINGLLRALRDRKGHIVGIGSISGKINSPQGGVYAGTKAGFDHFLKQLFDETRKSGVKITRIIPDLTRTAFYDELHFEPDSIPEAHLTPGEVAEAVIYALDNPQGVVTEIELRPQKMQIRKK